MTHSSTIRKNYRRTGSTMRHKGSIVVVCIASAPPSADWVENNRPNLFDGKLLIFTENNVSYWGFL